MPDQNSVYVFATLTASAGKEAELRQILRNLVDDTRKEPGNLSYHLYEGTETPGTFLVYECYQDQSAVETHMASPHLQAALAAAGPLLGAAPVITSAKEVA
ncbi:putative quinol monooxygenase [Acidocella aminolytica]|jgi:quinol monooxygenase YgiN|uniref:Antibiotic biosynthesis monooxygenase n=1 Tax=Acidocella aminolytica 101 = DSM 11237 TaxID=1120923 RepID=A0A0D6PHW8_9PROT|nr:putative quinol monooxygenase [Acidocella aminolytica]GAN81247.1 antibiotic biosynthesis monooxygenase [Acidocella aminolytica 101 = DSM 11237]GBQ41156.1 antibiotic biosynthesis monooxygenase [Acidocella aminolytica 101 = DSM 11237]SHE84415.1 Quinol monooxygenase YgiN [Acidocella aminolytica 101 = DSM 11237]